MPLHLPYFRNLAAYVEYVLYAALLAVRFGLWSGSSQALCCVLRMASSEGGLSTRYDIQACHPGSICPLQQRNSVSAGLDHEMNTGCREGDRTDHIPSLCSLPIWSALCFSQQPPNRIPKIMDGVSQCLIQWRQKRRTWQLLLLVLVVLVSVAV